MSGKKQATVASFFNKHPDSAWKTSSSKKRSGSHFGTCPLCEQSIPFHRLELHAATCDGSMPVVTAAPNRSTKPRSSEDCERRTAATPPQALAKPTARLRHLLDLNPTSEPIPGLFLYEDFITEDEEQNILSQLDGTTDPCYESTQYGWNPSTFNGRHRGQRWGVHCDLRSRAVGAAERPLPSFITQFLLPKLRHLHPMKGCVPNEANAIDYHRKHGDYLVAHVDDRQLSREPIANLSLAGDCYMTFTNVAPKRNTAVVKQRVLLKRRCLQILTGLARYDFSHGIEHCDLLSERRVSLTMRESPLTRTVATGIASLRPAAGLPVLPPRSMEETIKPGLEPIHGLFIFPEFITIQEEALILTELDSLDGPVQWSLERHTGLHREKRWGVDHDLWSRELRPPKHALPDFMREMLVPRLQQLLCMNHCIPNEVNAIEYRKALGHSLVSHVDDRQKHKEPIANLSLAGDCYMTYTNVKDQTVRAKKVLLPRRTLQVLTGRVRYDYAHGIANADLLSDRRVSLTMRETIGVGHGVGK
jgi:alkylated DNA repair dioxygenase AlkB